MSSRRAANPKYRPYAFTDQGVAMLSSVLRSTRAVQVKIEIMRAFVRLRQMLQANAELARRLAALEKKYDAQFRIVFDAIRELMSAPTSPQRAIGFRSALGDNLRLRGVRRVPRRRFLERERMTD